MSSAEVSVARRDLCSNPPKLTSFETESEGNQKGGGDKFKSSLEMMHSQNLNSIRVDDLHGQTSVKTGPKKFIPKVAVSAAAKSPSANTQPGVFSKGAKAKPGIVSSGTTKASSRPLSKQGSGLKEPQAHVRAQPASRDGSLRKPAAPATNNRMATSAAKPQPVPTQSPGDKPKKKLLFAK